MVRQCKACTFQSSRRFHHLSDFSESILFEGRTNAFSACAEKDAKSHCLSDSGMQRRR